MAAATICSDFGVSKNSLSLFPLFPHLFAMKWWNRIAVKTREVKSKGEKERHAHLNAEFQRIARRDKKDFLSDQCKEIEENNRMVKTKYWEPAYCILSAALSTASSFRIWNSSTGIYHCQEPEWGAPSMTKVMRKEARHMQRRDQASGVPLEILEHLPPKPDRKSVV